MNLKKGQTYKLISIEEHKPCNGDCTPCVVNNLLIRGFLPDCIFTVEQILGNNAMLRFESGDVFAVSVDHLTTCEIIEHV